MDESDEYHELHIRIDWLNPKSYQTDAGMDSLQFDKDCTAFIAEMHNKLISTAVAWAHVHETGKTKTVNPNPHEHYYLKCTRTCKDVGNDIRAILKKWGADKKEGGRAHKGNAAYSCKQVKDYIRVLNYLRKENMPEYHNIPQEDIDRAIAYQKEMDLKRLKEEVKKLEFWPQLRHDSHQQDWFSDLHVNKPDTQREYNARRSLMQFIINRHKEQARMIRVNIIQVYYDTILTDACPDTEYQFLVSRLRL